MLFTNLITPWPQLDASIPLFGYWCCLPRTLLAAIADLTLSVDCGGFGKCTRPRQLYGRFENFLRS